MFITGARKNFVNMLFCPNVVLFHFAVGVSLLYIIEKKVVDVTFVQNMYRSCII